MELHSAEYASAAGSVQSGAMLGSIEKRCDHPRSHPAGSSVLHDDDQIIYSGWSRKGQRHTTPGARWSSPNPTTNPVLMKS